MWKLRGHIRKIEQGIEKLEPGCYITVWVPKHRITMFGETDEQAKKRILEYGHLHPGEIEFHYVEEKNEK